LTFYPYSIFFDICSDEHNYRPASKGAELSLPYKLQKAIPNDGKIALGRIKPYNAGKQ